MDEPFAETTLARILDELVSIPAVEEAMILTRNGRILAGRTDAPAFAQECRSLVSAATASEESREEFVRLDLRGSRRSTVVLSAGQEAILAVRMNTRTPESLSLELSRAADAVRRTVS
ncbi:MAG TPA: roadblock/LC7 domain-containing protein [Thermoplasmata archaeon]|nr:roadblock/LC7 domain-containing protein [Thermoplasmata archaeon]